MKDLIFEMGQFCDFFPLFLWGEMVPESPSFNFEGLSYAAWAANLGSKPGNKDRKQGPDNSQTREHRPAK